jgi:CHAT domain-containing protein
MSRPYDVLHYAGHCYFDEKDPTASGWVFSDGRVISANLLNRIDRVPKFVFSNACESGVTPDRPEDYSVGLAPSFAEAFFQRGVANFVCTAWPIDDGAARSFALELYRNLLGLGSGPDAPRPMHRAMLAARVAIARTRDGARTWGAYQHYGDPFFRLFRAAK